VTARDETSIAEFGENEIEVDLEYVVNVDSANSLANYLKDRYKRGIQRMEDVNIIGDPLLEVGDRVTLTFSPMGVDQSYWIENIDDVLSPDAGYNQKVDLSIADEGNWFVLGTSLLGGTDHLM
jgi:hypothetical protein